MLYNHYHYLFPIFFSLPQSEILNPLNNNFPFFPPTLCYHICDKEKGGT